MGCFQILVVSFAFVFFISLNSEAASPEFRTKYCSNTTFTQNSTYHSNRNLLFASLNSNATRQRGFYNTTVGRGPDILFGSFLCRGDLAPDDCRNCVGTATNDVAREHCPRGNEAILWYDQCMLRYSNENFFGIMNEAPRAMMYNRGNINDPNRFSRLLGDVMDDSIKSAVDGDRRFGTKEANYSVLQTLYSLVQCTPDLSGSDCNRCLRGAAANLPVCCAGSQGANILYPSCNIRYEVYPFYNTTAGSPPATLTPPTLPPPPPPLASRRNGGKIYPAAVVSICVAIAAVLLMSIGFWYCLKRRRERDVKDEYNAVHNDQNAADEITTVESLQYDFSTIQTATNNFSDDNKLGEGGFGTVYMGKLSNGQEIAVKRLSSTSLQGSAEFKNEVILVAKLQHRNLTRLLGFCLEREEKILIYEFVPNKSLDKLLFDQLNDQETLDWTRRFKIIGGIARGTLYLHEDSRLRIIHRDLKASNILLDEQMNPKISDFGMAKICGVDQTRGSTSRIVGTFGYMAPEYAFYGQFSVKSDVFSFGVLIIEIVTGKKCTRFQGSDSETEDLLSFAWKNWRNGTALEIIDQRLGDSYTANEVMRCIHIGLLCVQEDPVERPTMATIVLMLSSFSVSLPLPKKPAFFPHTRTEEIKPEQDKSKSSSPSVNEMSITETYPR